MSGGPADGWPADGRRTPAQGAHPGPGEDGRVRRYLAILRVRAARNPFLSSVVGRLPISMVPLALVLLVQQVRGSYSIAGIITGAYALGATLGTPVLGRLVDRLGQPRVIGTAGAPSAVLLAAPALTAAAGAGDPPPLALPPPRARRGPRLGARAAPRGASARPHAAGRPRRTNHPAVLAARRRRLRAHR